LASKEIEIGEKTQNKGCYAVQKSTLWHNIHWRLATLPTAGDGKYLWKEVAK